jgi:DNA-binding MarR family transcriptional regulator
MIDTETQVLNAVMQHWKEESNAPSLGDIASRLGLGRSTIVYHMKHLITAGKLVSSRGLNDIRPAGLEITFKETEE